jgi:hypothetical protein
MDENPSPQPQDRVKTGCLNFDSAHLPLVSLVLMRKSCKPQLRDSILEIQPANAVSSIHPETLQEALADARHQQ